MVVRKKLGYFIANHVKLLVWLLIKFWVSFYILNSFGEIQRQNARLLTYRTRRTDLQSICIVISTLLSNNKNAMKVSSEITNNSIISDIEEIYDAFDRT